MAWICNHLSNVSIQTQHEKIWNISLDIMNNETAENDSFEIGKIKSAIMLNGGLLYGSVVKNVVIPGICVCGLAGNLLTLVVLLRRITECTETLERGSLIGMIGVYTLIFMAIRRSIIGS